MSSIIRSAMIWLGLASPDGSSETGSRHVHGHGRGLSHAHGHGHDHTHGVVDPTITTTARGLWAVKWSFVILAITALLQFVVVLASGSVALLADTIHNFGDAGTAIPLAIAFLFARRKASSCFTYGYGRIEDLAGVLVVLIILFSALTAGYEAIERLIHPRAIGSLGWVAVAGLLGFVGNEAVAVFRIRVGRQINSAALIADGFHARTDGLTSLAVVLGALGVRLGFPLADPIIGLLITMAIFGIVWQSATAVLIRMLDGVEPGVVDEIRHAAGHVVRVKSVSEIRARWIGHRLAVELVVTADRDSSLGQADAIAEELEHELHQHLSALTSAHIRVRPERGYEGTDNSNPQTQHSHSHGAVRADTHTGHGS